MVDGQKSVGYPEVKGYIFDILKGYAGSLCLTKLKQKLLSQKALGVML
jgi:hypothetical protein